MGRFTYAGGEAVLVIDDRTLRHVQVAMATKLRRGESFAFTLSGEHVPSGLGSHTLWIAPSISLEFGYRTAAGRIPLNRHWVEALIASASSLDGLRIVPEPDS